MATGGKLVLNKNSAHAKACWEKSLSLGETLYSFVERSERLWQLLHSLVRYISKDIGDRTSAEPFFSRSTIDLPACFCMGRYLRLEPILPIVTPVAALWRSTCKPCASLPGRALSGACYAFQVTFRQVNACASGLRFAGRLQGLEICIALLRCSRSIAAASLFARPRASLPWYKNTRRRRNNRLWSP